MSEKISKEEFFPVISDEVITLSWKYKFDAVDINKEEEATFDIVLNDTNEIIGFITFNYFNKSGFSYSGNVGTEIFKDFRNKRYATRALILLKQLLKSNEYSGDKTLYFSVDKNNNTSQKIVEKNGGELIYDGDVPYGNPINFVEGIKKVKIYKMEL